MCTSCAALVQSPMAMRGLAATPLYIYMPRQACIADLQIANCSVSSASAPTRYQSPPLLYVKVTNFACMQAGCTQPQSVLYLCTYTMSNQCCDHSLTQPVTLLYSECHHGNNILFDNVMAACRHHSQNQLQCSVLCNSTHAV